MIRLYMIFEHNIKQAAGRKSLAVTATASKKTIENQNENNATKCMSKTV